MRSAAATILLAFVVPAHVVEMTTNRKTHGRDFVNKTAGKLVDILADRAWKAWCFHHADLDQTALAKTHPNARHGFPQINPTFSVSHSSLYVPQSEFPSAQVGLALPCSLFSVSRSMPISHAYQERCSRRSDVSGGLAALGREVKTRAATARRQEAEVAPAAELDREGHVWYCGIGSMMSQVALGLRGIRPKKSSWCEIQGYTRIHEAPGGMSTIFPEVGSVVQAVAHQITPAELKLLEAREPPSSWIDVRLRDGNAVVGTVTAAVSIWNNVLLLQGLGSQNFSTGFRSRVAQNSSGAFGFLQGYTEDSMTVICRNSSHKFDTDGVVTVNQQPIAVPVRVERTRPVASLPSARYVDLMVEGALAVDMDSAEINKIKSTSHTPRVNSSDLRKFSKCNTSTLRAFSRQELEALPNPVVFRGMVLMDPTAESTTTASPNTNNTQISQLRLGLDAWLSTQFYDPLYGKPPGNPLEPWAGWDWIEDMAVRFFPKHVQIGWVDFTDPSDDVKQ